MFSSFFNAAAGGYEIEQSLRFERTDSAHLRRTFGTPTTQNVYTYSTWLKYIGWGDSTFTRSNYKDTWLLSPYQDNNDWGALQVNNDLKFLNYTSDNESRGTDGGISTNMLVRDPSAWYHVIFVLDATQSALSDRMEIYVNGVKQSVSSTNNPVGQNQTTILNKANTVHDIGRNERIGQLDANARYFSMMLAETHFVDGQALDATDFGEFDDNGVWRPIQYTGTYGNNGFYLTYDPSATNGIGHDHSGNGNNFTANNFTTSGTGTDVMSDTPTTNWCTLNPLSVTSGTFSEGNLKFVGASSFRKALGTVAVNSGKWYFESTLQGAPNSSRNSGSDYNSFGFIQATVFDRGGGIGGNTDCVLLGDNGYYTNFANSVTDVGALSNGDVLGCAIDLDGGNFEFFRNGTSLASGSLGAGYTSGEYLVPTLASYSSTYGPMILNFGQRAFEQTPPTGFSALNTANLPAPTVKDGSEYFDTKLYTGTDASLTVNYDFSPDFVWIKSRSHASDHSLYDIVRGTNLQLRSNSNIAELNDTNGFNSFDTDGFTLGVDTGDNINAASRTYAAWAWDAGGSGSSNTAGSITSTVSANPTAGFSIVTFTKTGGTTTSNTVGHGLGVAPAMLILKGRVSGNVDNWYVYHQSLGPTYRTFLNTTDASFSPTETWNSTAPTSSVFTVKNFFDGDSVAYCFAEVEGYSKFGTYTGNGSTTGDGPFVFLGFKPAWIMIKNADLSGGNWRLFDTTRQTYNVGWMDLYANDSTGETAHTAGTTNQIDILSNGFKLRDQYNETNQTGATLVFAAFAENPFGGSGVSPATAR